MDADPPERQGPAPLRLGDRGGNAAGQSQGPHRGRPRRLLSAAPSLPGPGEQSAAAHQRRRRRRPACRPGNGAAGRSHAGLPVPHQGRGQADRRSRGRPRRHPAAAAGAVPAAGPNGAGSARHRPAGLRLEGRPPARPGLGCRADLQAARDARAGAEYPRRLPAGGLSESRRPCRGPRPDARLSRHHRPRGPRRLGAAL